MNTQTMLPQDLNVARHLEALGSITSIEASTLYKVRCITSNISRLRKHGMSIATEFKKDITGQRYARYRVSMKGAKL
jgi:hypothetical protein